MPSPSAANSSLVVGGTLATAGPFISPFIADLGLPSDCPADLDNGTGSGTIDCAVDIDDLVFFLIGFESGSLAVDLDNGSGNGIPDNAVTVDDLLFFLVRSRVAVQSPLP